MQKEYTLWGTKKGNPSWQEDIITNTTDIEHLNKAKQWAIENGFINLRVTTWQGEAPDFVGALNIHSDKGSNE